MPGGLLAADRNYWWEIGGYDDGMEVWGGESIYKNIILFLLILNILLIL